MPVREYREATGLKPPQVLLVEDNPAHAELIMRCLLDHEVANEVVHVEDGQQALDYLLRQGEYAAQSTKNLGFTISVNLNSDHTAVTRYDYADGSNSTRELGYWQALSDSEVEVVSTVHQGQRLVAKRVYTQQGEQLVATKETVNGTDYPLQDGGIVLFKVP